MDATSLPDGVELLLAPNPSMMTGPGTNTFLVWDPRQEAAGAVAVDPGPEDMGHLERIAQHAALHGGLRAILVTHGHPDHLEGAPRLRERTGAPILAWSREGSPQADRALADEEEVLVGGRALRAVYTPGHRFDHLCFLLEDADALFAGDLVAGTGTVVIAPPEGDLLDYMASLRRLLALDLRLILPAHGPAIERPSELLEQYIQHRNDRERQVLDGLGHGLTTVPDLVVFVYTDVDPKLHGMAALSLTAHLLKLEREGRVIREVGVGGTETWRLQA
jgi:glyoxylase-like metal-dependent hydrolase (beta-lactamase superfamily II)